MIGKAVKCQTCKRFFMKDESPWCGCEIYTDDIPDDIYQNDLASPTKIKCSKYEFNPHWNDIETA